MKKVIKAFRYHQDEQPRYLFHGNCGSTVVPLDTWIKADEKLVQDGSGKTYYTSGFHAFTTKECLEEWKKTTKHKHVVTNVYVKETRKKSHSRHKQVVLAKWLYVPSRAWKHALKKWKNSL